MGTFNPLSDAPKIRLSTETRQLAARYLRGEFRNRLTTAEFNIAELSLPEDMDPAQKRAEGAFLLASKGRLEILPEERLAGAAPYLEAKWHRIPGLDNTSSISHTTVDFSDAVRKGLSGLQTELQTRRAIATPEEQSFCDALLRVISAMRLWVRRYHDALISLDSELPADNPHHDNLRAVISRLERVPEYAPQNFAEAVQSLWSFYEFQRFCGNWSGLGRLDELLGGYLANDLENGRITLDEARELIAHFWIKGTEWCYGLAKDNPQKPGSGDAQHYQNVILGGIDVQGNIIENDVTYLILDVIEELHISDFPVAVRLNSRTSEKLLKRIAEVQLHGGGIVSVYNEDLILKALTTFGFPPHDARAFTNDGCWEVIIPGKTRFGYIPFDILKIFQDALLATPAPTTFDGLYYDFLKRLREMVHAMAANTVREHAYHGCDCVLSLLEPSCRQSLRSYQAFGTDYTVKAIHAGGLPDVANSLRAIEEFVFKRKLLSLPELIDILKNNWEGHEDLRQTVKNDIRYYGNDDTQADAIMSRVFRDYARIAGEIHSIDGIYMPVGASTFGREIQFAPHRIATAFGAHAHDYLAPNLSPTPGTDRSPITSVLNSYCKMDFMQSPNGCPLDLRLGAAVLKLPNAAELLAQILKTFLASGGWYLQIDVVDADMLRAAQREPDRYPNLVVRISGWSARFASLSKEWQDMIINRTSLAF